MADFEAVGGMNPPELRAALAATFARIPDSALSYVDEGVHREAFAAGTIYDDETLLLVVTGIQATRGRSVGPYLLKYSNIENAQGEREWCFFSGVYVPFWSRQHEAYGATGEILRWRHTKFAEMARLAASVIYNEEGTQMFCDYRSTARPYEVTGIGNPPIARMPKGLQRLAAEGSRGSFLDLGDKL